MHPQHQSAVAEKPRHDPRPGDAAQDEQDFQRLLRRTAITLLLALLVPIMVLAGMVELVRWSARWVDHTDRVIAEINLIEKQLITMQSEFRGYRLLGDRTLLASYAQARGQLEPHFETLLNLTRDNPGQSAAAVRFRDASLQWAAALETGMARLAAGEALENVNKDMILARSQVNAALANAETMTQEEARLRALRDVRRDRAFSALITLIGVAVVVGIPLGVLWITRLLRRVGASYQANLDAAVRANRAKDEFMATLSHELRTPLTPVLLSAAALREDPALSPEIREQLGMIERNISLEARLIDDLLDLTRISRGLLQLRTQAADAHSLISLATEIVRPDARAKGIVIGLSLGASRSGLTADPARFQQLIWNLLRNAVKFTPAGGRIDVATENHAAPDGSTWLRIAVTDSGIGIDPAKLEMIFEPFERGSLNGDHRFGGLGLGLAIARAVVQLHGGHISAQSAGQNQGATFMVEFPGAVIPAATSAATTSLPVTAIKPLRLLLVEDHENTLKALQRLLQRDGHHVITASSVTEALAQAEVHRFDLVISDLGLPDGTGNDLMEKLRVSHGLRGLALSGYGMDKDLARSRQAGFFAHLVKPVVFSELQRTLAAMPPPEPGK